MPAKPAAAADQPGDLNLRGDAGVPPPEGAVVEGVANNDRAAVEALQKKVDIAINNVAQADFGQSGPGRTDHPDAEAEVLAAAEPTPEEKDVMLRKLKAVGNEIEQQKIVFEHNRQRMIEDAAAQREREMVLAQMERDKTKVHQLFERFDALMAEGRHKLAEEAVGMEAKSIVDRVPLADAKPDVMVAVNASRLQGAWSDILAVRTARQRGFVDALFQVEKSHVPTADEPAVVYPDSEWWKEMSTAARINTAPWISEDPHRGGKEDPGGLKVAYAADRIRRDAAEGRRAVSRGPDHVEIQLDAAGLERRRASTLNSR